MTIDGNVPAGFPEGARGGAPHPRLLAFHLPQFHPVPENDAWWGPGFTEWRNVVRARPVFPGHQQPNLPADLGLYDLRVPDVRAAQANLARAHGIHGFCYYHYWFAGRRILERPVNEILATGEPDFPFSLCWANENWTRRWDGNDAEVLLAERYGDADDADHLNWLASAFADPRYIRVNGKPLFAVWRARRIPDPLRTTTIWRERAHRLGLGDLYLCRVEAFPEDRGDPSLLGFDAAIEFAPDWVALAEPVKRGRLWSYARTLGLADRTYQRHRIFEYADLVARMLAKPPAHYRRFPSVTPGWDNTPRKPDSSWIVRGSTPEAYEAWLRAVVGGFRPFGPGEDFVFLNAWNEWAEGAYLEPDQRWGRAYLEATRRALPERRTVTPAVPRVHPERRAAVEAGNGETRSPVRPSSR